MNIEQLVKMANQIGDFFQSYPDHEQAKKDIASHLQRFWAPQMRQQIMQHINTHPSDNGLAPLVSSAIKEYLH
ncbi:formate dehydrogenase subunit delta [Methylobacillus flagellatus]|uniref:Formate dehydrogenase delta subunit n=1 Tax=Methylobacillus flagellatus (strain ATCC 51484 / DSM 6875 / VKM B-1610 / KT) TaxID=265072 RepID=Q1H3F1_METFK|nr:formate dehydrogenase subunit delta [Methylobacillus flagellatus]ABE48986.1 formate dehydrogenase delta subunit [Methylobacillus flagellatus KT]